MTLTFISLFAGIGGIDLGLERAGMRCVAQVEIDDYCNRVLAKHWPDVPRFADVRAVGAHNLPRADVIAGGFPCQDISNAGKRAGIDGNRSGLWAEFARIIGELRPRYVLVENVSALLSGGEWEAVHGRCICGWDYRWGGMHHDSPIPTGAVVQHPNRCGDVPEGLAPLGAAPSGIWRGSSADAGINREMGSSIGVGHIRQTSRNIPGTDHPMVVIESRTSAVSVVSPTDDRQPGSESEWLGALDAGSKGSWYDDSPSGSGIESQRARLAEHAGGWMDCPSCGRAMDDTTTRYVYRSWMGRVLGDLAAIGYDAEWHCIPAAAVGAPHIRDRVFIVAYPNCTERWPESKRRDEPNRDDAGWQKATSGLATYRKDGRTRLVADSASARLFPATLAGIYCQEKSRGTRNVEPERCSWWATEPDVGRMAHGVPNRVQRLRGLGNAVVPQCAEFVGRLIVAHTNQETS
jgi:site-specific DNA-cytosine methylase